VRNRRRIPTAVCRYLSFTDPKLKTTFRLPLVNVRLKAHNSFKTIGLVDSGATTTFIPYEHLGILGLEKEYNDSKEHSTVGAGGTFQTRTVTLDLMEIFKGVDVFCHFNQIRVNIPPKDALPYVVLGRNYIFREHDITFRELQEHTIFRYPPKK
jgi:hypothetical protein